MEEQPTYSELVEALQDVSAILDDALSRMEAIESRLMVREQFEKIVSQG